MSEQATLLEVGRGRLADDVGGKATNLAWLVQHGFKVPRAFVVPARHAKAAGRAALGAELAARLDPLRAYAVRSSADVEDGPGHSFAGLFTSVLAVRGIPAILEAVEAVIASRASDGVTRYAERAGIDPASIRMAVVVQEMIEPVAAGVAFSRNPLTGLDEIVIEAVPGRGDALVQGGVTPDRWVHRWGDVIERPAEPSIDPTVVDRVVGDVKRIVAAYGEPVDVEWAWDGTTLWWLQVRPLSGTSDVPIYSNRIAREVLPGIIKPLVWSVNIPIVNRAWVDLFTMAIGPNDIDPDRLARAFGYRAYFDMRAIGDIFAALGMPRESLELLLGLPAGKDRPRFRGSRATMRHLPRMLRLLGRLNSYDRQVDGDLPRLEARAARLAAVDLGALSERELLDQVDEVADLTRAAAFMNIVVPLLMNAYGALVRRRAAAHGLDPARVDPARDDPRVRAFDPSHGLATMGRLAHSLSEATRADLVADGVVALDRRAEDGGAEAPVVARLRDELDGFRERFGHLSASGNDLSVPRWREDPDQLLRMALEAPEPADGDTIAWADLAEHVSRLERPILRRVFRRAARFRLERERVSSSYTAGYGLFRPAFLELARRLRERGVLAADDDVFYLTLAELRALAGRGDDPIGDVPAASVVARRRAEVDEAGLLDMPELILGDDFTPRHRGSSPPRELRGVPASRGTYRGPIRVIRSGSEFGRMIDGAVLAVPFSDVAWTPLFVRAGAVIAEAGGMLAHSSIIARERGIPCVVSVDGATALEDGTIVHVDGYRGIVSIET